MTEEAIMIVNGSTIEISRPCNRVYLTNFYNYNSNKTVVELDKIAQEQNLEKIIARIPSYSKEIFLNNGYKIEAHIPAFFKNQTDGYFMAKFFTKEREIFNKDLSQKVLEKAFEKSGFQQEIFLENGLYLKKIEKDETEALIKLYKDVFENYPTPIFEREYIIKTMEQGCDYLGIFKEEKIVATAAAEKNFLENNAELSAFAILPQYRGKNLALFLIKELEQILKQQEIKTSYAIARAGSFGMNIAFAKMEYIYAGTLVNNTCFGKSLENMNVWYKKL